jgi:hypothetical protein
MREIEVDQESNILLHKGQKDPVKCTA